VEVLVVRLVSVVDRRPDTTRRTGLGHGWPTATP